MWKWMGTPAAAIVAVAIALRLAWVLCVPTKPVGDFAMYLESAWHLLAHGSLDPTFVYMPGYVFVVAALQGLGGGLAAVKIAGAVLGGLGAGVVYGLAGRLWSTGAAVAAAALYAIWPAGIAVASVTGTDMPAGVLIGAAIYCLVRWAPTRPWLAAVAFGAAMGVAAYTRAVALPLSILCAFYWASLRLRLRTVVTRTAAACAVAALVLAPWVVRNRLRYGEWLATDSHGGLTALVGANPNSEGTYSRSLNRIFFEVTGHELLSEPHRQADRAAYALALDWTRFEPAYAVGLAVKKAERLLGPERGLLYWPIYRAGVLRDPDRTWFAERQGKIEAVVDGFWVFLVVAGVTGLGVALATRQWARLSLLPFGLALVGIYTLFFAEVRYRLPIALLVFPSAGGALAWLVDGARTAVRERSVPVAFRREVGWAALSVLVVFAGWAAFVGTGQRLRDRHAWALHRCRVGTETVVCKWRAESRTSSGASLPRGVFDGVGLRTMSASAGARLMISPGVGGHRLRAQLDVAPLTSGSMPSGGTVSIQHASGQPLARVDLDEIVKASRAGGVVDVDAPLAHAGGLLDLVFRIEAVQPEKVETREGTGEARVWLSQLEIAPEAHLPAGRTHKTEGSPPEP
jgi:4-amino-4-deoxy-L-arabinose transferase-like glycosyltransferase